ncbi:pentatricopeptide repeat-containing protein At1g80270, mitochondrial-like [Ipomoea triloba]|uniref:pentatricopeptide repeat-containing protein At1g80270, mitochondrial-like n=1 Tax=Ipomoea triloba TaxID=35885 RepID=UPI00125CE1FA|nr:pentatricopeptide repeat-containing protein At1g80270, mitochondrial-like [Ipomoea triloba]
MWALRRASSSLRKQGLNIQNTRIMSPGLGISNRCLEDCDSGVYWPAKAVTDRFLSLRKFHKTARSSPAEVWGIRSFSSQADTKSSGGEDDELDGFSDLESPATSGAIQKDIVDNNEDLVSESDLSEEDINDDFKDLINLSDTEAEISEKKSPRKRVTSKMFKAILDNPASSVSNVMNKWVEEGNEVTRLEVAVALTNLRKRRMFVKALQLSEWLESSRKIDFTERDFACRVDLIAKVRGLQRAEAYMQHIPSSEVVYRTLLANSVSAVNVKKSEEVFNKMKELEMPITCFAYNQLLLLYKRTDKKKIADVLLLMDKENVKPSHFTYQMLIDTKGQVNDIEGMEQIVETMKDEGLEPDIRINQLLAKHYIAAGCNEKAEVVLKKMEGGNIKENRWACQILLPLYASLGMAEDVSRIWQVCKSNPKIDECVAGIQAWGRLKKIEEAEDVFDILVNKYKKAKNSISKGYYTLLSAYADNKMLAKGKELVKQMGESDFPIGPLTWDAVIKLYCNAGEVEKADSILKKAGEKGQRKPLLRSYITIMDEYAKRGDVHNSEKIFYRMRQVGYTSRLKQFQTLIQAYINAKVPAYGMSERLKADNIFPNKALAGMMAQVDGFRKTAVSEILD